MAGLLSSILGALGNNTVGQSALPVNGPMTDFSQGGGLLSGVDGSGSAIGGGAMGQNARLGESRGLFGTGFLDLTDPQTMMAMQLIDNGSKPPGQMFSGVPEIAAYGARMRHDQQERAAADRDRRDKQELGNRTDAWIRQHHPEYAPQLDAGIPAAEVWKTIASQRPEIKVIGDRPYIVDNQAMSVTPVGGFETSQAPLSDIAKLQADHAAGRVDDLGYQLGLEKLMPKGMSLQRGPNGELSIGPGADPETQGNQFKNELEVLKTYRNEDDVKAYRDNRASYQRMRESAASGNSQGDIGLIFGFMKMLDPASVVREGEFATAENSGGVSESIQNLYNRALNGERLTPQQRQDFLASAERYYGQSVSNLNEVNEYYNRLADEYGIPRERFVLQPQVFEPLKIGEAVNTTVNGKDARIRKVR